jgi:hypothetical protein
MEPAESPESQEAHAAARPDPADPQRLQRQLRALSAVNRQLHAQLEGGTVRLAGTSASGARGSLTVRRATEGAAWLEHLHLHGGGDPMLVRTPSRGMYVVEGNMRRTVKSGILFNALTRVLGEPKEMPDAEVERWSTGPPVEVLEAGTGPAFLVVGGRRLPLRGLPLPFLVSTNDMLLFPEGEELNVAASRVVPKSRVARARAAIEKDGAVKGSAKLVQKAARRATRAKPQPDKS